MVTRATDGTMTEPQSHSERQSEKQSDHTEEEEKELEHEVDGSEGRSTRTLPAEPESERAVEDPAVDTVDAVNNSSTTASVPLAEQVLPPYSIHSTWAKRGIVMLASLGALISPLTGQIYLPALNAISSDLRITASQVNLTVTTYMIFQGITPMFVGGIADGVGRRPAYAVCFVVFIAANIGLALCRNYASLLVVRCVQSAGSSSTVALCQAVSADITSSAERGQYIAFTLLPVVFAPSIGPVLGGVLSQYLGWRSIFWFLAILAGVIFVGLALFLPETCRKIVGDGSIRPPTPYLTLAQLFQEARRRWQQRRRQQKNQSPEGQESAEGQASSAGRARKLQVEIPNVLTSVRLVARKEIGLLLLYSSLLFAGFYAVGTALPQSLEKEYGLSELQIGLCYLPVSLGSVVVVFCVAPFLDRNFARHARKLGLARVDKSRQHDLSAFPIERARLEVALPLYLLSCAFMLCWGWALQKKAHLAVLCVLLFLNGVGMMGFNNAANTLLLDVTPGRAGAAVASNNLIRCLVGAAGTALIDPMINRLGLGWAFFLIGMIYVAFLPGLFLLQSRGIAWRRASREAEARKQARSQARSRVEQE